MLSDEEVLQSVCQARQGDHSAAKRLLLHLEPAVRGWIRRHLPRREDEEDLLQEVFMKLLQKLDRYEERSGIPFQHWVSRLTVRTCLDALRHEKARPEWRFADLSEGQKIWADYLMHGQEAQVADGGADAKALVHFLLAQLAPTDRLILTLMDLEQLSTQEISQRTGWSRPMIKMRAMRARRKLRQIADQHLSQDER